MTFSRVLHSLGSGLSSLRETRGGKPGNEWSEEIEPSSSFNIVVQQMLDVLYNNVRSFSRGFKVSLVHIINGAKFCRGI